MGRRPDLRHPRKPCTDLCRRTDWRDFLQGLITQDVETMAPGEARFGALLTPQGRLLYDLFVVPRGDGAWLDVEAKHRDAVIQRPDHVPVAGQGGDRRRRHAGLNSLPRSSPRKRGPRLFAWRRFGPARARIASTPKQKTPGSPLSRDERICKRPASARARLARLRRLAARRRRPGRRGGARGPEAAPGRPRTGRLGLDKTYPIEANFDLLNGIDFKKGCFVGRRPPRG